MGIHFILLSIVYILCFIYRIRRDNMSNKKTNTLLFAFIVMAIFIGFRTSNIGIDTKYYVMWYQQKNYDFANFEVLLPIISFVIHIFSSKYCVYLLCLSLISLFGIYKCSVHYKFNTELFLFLYITSYCFIYCTSAIRFFCAFSIIIYSFIYMIKKDDLKVLLLILLASMFHLTAIIFIPIYIFTKFKYNKKNIIFLTLILLLFVGISNTIGIDFLLQTRLFSKYEYVLESKNSLGGISFLINSLILLFSFIYYKSIKLYKEDYEFFIKMQLIATALDFIGIASRFIWYFKFPVWFIIPIILINIKSSRKKDYMLLYILFIIIFSLCYYYYLSHALPDNNFLKYEFNYKFE